MLEKNLACKKEFIDTVNYPMCLINIDDNYTIVHANVYFYQMINCSERDIQFKFNHSLSALLNIDAVHSFNQELTNKENTVFGVEHTLYKEKSNPIEVYSLVIREASFNYAYIISRSIETCKDKEAELEALKQKTTYIYEHLNFDVFEYDDKNEEIIINKSRVFFPRKMPKIIALKEIIAQEIIHPNSFHKFEQALKKASDGEDVTLEIEVKGKNNNYHYAKLFIGKIETNGKSIILGVLSDIDTEKEAIMKYLNETRFYQAILSYQDGYGHVDVTLDKFTRIGGILRVYNDIIGNTSFTKIGEEFINKVVYAEDRERYFEIMSCDNFITSFNGGITYLEYEFRRIVDQHRVVWKRLQIHLFKNSSNSHIMALLYFKNIDEQKRKELTYSYEMQNILYQNVYDKRSTEILVTNYLKSMNTDALCALVIIRILPDNNEKLAEKQTYRVIEVLNSKIRRIDIIGRMKNEEYVVFFKDVGSKKEFEKRLVLILSSVEENRTSNIQYQLGISFVKQDQSFTRGYLQAQAALQKSRDIKDNIYTYYHGEAIDTVSNLLEIEEKSSINKEKDTTVEDTILTFNDFVGEYGDMAYLIDPNTYDLLYANEAFYNRIGKVASQCASMKCYEAVHQRKTPCPFCAKANWSSDKYHIYRNYNEGLEQEFIVKNRLVEWHGTRAVLAIAIDVANDKKIVDSMENGTTENSYILSGVQHMQEANTLEESAITALENIGQFFRARTVRYWRHDTDNKYYCQHSWSMDTYKHSQELKEEESLSIIEWLSNRNWQDEFNADSPEMMFSESYELYQIMKDRGIANQRWIPVSGSGNRDLISIDNVTINFSNTSFMPSFISFMISEFIKRDMLENIIHTNYHDPLTGLLNRNSYEEFVANYDEDKYTSLAIVASNINNLKKINTDSGFERGNDYLIQLGKKMQYVFGQKNVYRLSGDDYIVILTDVSKEFMEDKVKELQTLIKNTNSFTVSLGYSWDNIEKDIPLAVEFATQTMIANKKRYHDTIKYSIDTERLKALNELVRSLQNGEFKIFLQAKYDSRKQKVIGAEALIRYYHEEYGIIPPAKYIDQIEKLNLIRYIDIYVFEETCKVLQKWQEEGRELPTISLNFSRLTLAEQDLVENLENIFNQYTIPKSTLEIEITESYGDIGKTLIYQNAIKLHDAGYAISLDDFGTKYTNLTILSEIVVDILKVDKSLVHALEKNKKNQVILKNLISMCNDLGIKVIAEGVETKEQEKMLNTLGCYLIQGYLYSKPIPISEFEEKYM